MLYPSENFKTVKFSLSSLPSGCRILVIKLRSIGDVVLNTPVLECLKSNFPESRLSVLVESPCEAVLQENPHVDEVLVRKKKVSSGNFFSVLWGDLKLILEIRRKKFDLVLDFHGGPRAANMTFLSGGTWKMGHENSPRRWAYNLHVKTPEKPVKVHAAEEQLSKLAYLGFKTEKALPAIWVSEDEKKTVRLLLEKKGIMQEDAFAAIHPGVLKPHQRWQPEKMAGIADHIQQNLGFKVVFVSTRNQRPQVDEINALMKSEPISFAGETDLRQLIVLLSLSRFLVCHNGGQMHLAAAVGIPVFALFGPSSPVLFGPSGKGHRVFYKDLPCSPCAPRPQFESCLQGRPECLERIEADEVIDAINDFSGNR